MSVAAERTLRASSLRSCPRKAVYESDGAPARERTLKEQRILYRGKSLGRDFVVMLASTEGMLIRVDSGPDYWVPPELRCPEAVTAGIVAEKRIVWECGTGHEDAFVAETATVLEVLSSAHASDAMVRSKMLQCVLYVEHDPDARAGALVVVDPSDLSQEVFPLAKTSKLYGELVEEMRDRIAQVQTWAEQGTLPARVCLKPSDAIGRFCLHAEHCFEGWEKPPLPVVDNEEARQLVTSLYRAKQHERDIRLTLATAETARKEIEQTLVDLIPVGKHQVGPLEIARTHIDRKPTFQWEKAETAGVFEPGLYDGYFKPGSSYDTFRVERVSDMPLPAADYGETPF